MVYTKVEKFKNKQAQQTVYIMNNEESFSRFAAYKKKGDPLPSRIGKEIAKGYLRTFLQNNQATLKDKVIHVTYLTDEGDVDLNNNVITGDNLTHHQLESLMADPKENINLASGEYNNSLQGKMIYGVAVSIFKHTAVKPQQSKAQKQSRYQFNFT